MKEGKDTAPMDFAEFLRKSGEVIIICERYCYIAKSR